MRGKNLQSVLILVLPVLLGILSFRWLAQDLAKEAPEGPPAGGAGGEARLGMDLPAGAGLHEAALRFARQVETRSGGQLTVAVHPNRELGTDDEMLEGARRGELAMVLIPLARLGIHLPAMQVLDLPFYFPSRALLYQALDGGLGRILLDRLRGIGLEGLALWEYGFKQITANRPIRTPEDFVALRVGVSQGRVVREQFRLFSALPVPVEHHATRQALVDGTIAGLENPLPATIGMGLHQVQSHLTMTDHAWSGHLFAVSRDHLASLSGAQQHLLLEVAREVAHWVRGENGRREEALLQTVREAGMTVHTLTPEERARFVPPVAHLPRKFAVMMGAELLAKSGEALLAQPSTGSGETLLVGLDAQLSGENELAGLEFSQGAALAIDDINADGGLLGRKVDLVMRDHHGLATRGRDNL
ncbi:MAG: TRAP transporter substrate-binding protein DctP, partial [Magnetococcales bacterium]|nr:TRAP transporter substrate-binding protein DctP [Magnetococcales bacterium]